MPLDLPRLDPLVRRIFVGVAFSTLGSGLTMPYLYTYLTTMRGISTATVGLLFAWMGVVSFVGSPIGGTVIDRIGPRPVIVAGLTIEAVGTFSLRYVDSPATAFANATLICLGTVGLYPATSSLLARIVPEEQREAVFGLQFMLLNLGLGVGGVIGSVLIDIHDVGSFRTLYLLDALTYLVYIAMIATLPRGTGAHVRTEHADGPQPGWGVVLRDTRLVRIVLLSVVVLTFGYAQFQTGFPAYATDVAGLDPKVLGWAFAANTGVIVIAQLFALRLIGGRRRSRMLALTAALWALAWGVVALTDAVTGPAAVAAAVIGLGVFGLGETLWAPVAPALINEIAVEELRGRYNALQSMTWTIAGVLGPALGGWLIGGGHPHLWAGLTVGGCLLAALLFPGLRRDLTDAEDGLAER